MYYDDELYGEEFGQFAYDDGHDRGGYFGPPPGGTGYPSPMGPPPNFSPPIPAWQYGPGGLRGCLYRNTYIWLRNGNSFWFFPTFVGRNMIIGFRWRGIGWIYSTINPNNIRSFQCF